MRLRRNSGAPHPVLPRAAPHCLFEHLYSVPYALRGEQLEGRATATTVEFFLRHQHVASHPRRFGPGHTTLADHMPSSHRAHAEWTPSRFLHWAGEVGR